jgi:transposase InsO family protein
LAEAFRVVEDVAMRRIGEQFGEPGLGARLVALDARTGCTPEEATAAWVWPQPPHLRRQMVRSKSGSRSSSSWVAVGRSPASSPAATALAVATASPAAATTMARTVACPPLGRSISEVMVSLPALSHRPPFQSCLPRVVGRRGQTDAADFWTRANAWFHQARVTVQKVLADNGACYGSHAFRDALGDIEHRRTRSRRPQTNGKNERFGRTLADEWAYARLYLSDTERCEQFSIWLHTYIHRRGHTWRPTTRQPRT